MKKFNMTGVCFPEKHHMVVMSRMHNLFTKESMDKNQFIVEAVV